MQSVTLETIYFDQSIRSYALSLTGNTFDADELVSTAFEICSSKSITGNLQGYFATVMKNQWLKRCNKKDIIDRIADQESVDIDGVLDRMYRYYSDILRAVYNGETLKDIHKGSTIPYRTLKEDYRKAKKEFKILHKDTKIALILLSNSGVDYHRLTSPFSKLKFEYGIDVEIHWNKDDEFIHKLEDVTHVIFNRNISVNMQPERVIGALKLMGIKVICDIDDYWELESGHPLRNFYKVTNYTKCQIANMTLSDQVWTTTDLLATEVKRYNKNVHVVKNAINNLDPQFNPDKIDLAFDTFFYSGGTTHRRDLKLLNSSFKDEKLLVKSPLVPKNMEATKVPVSKISEYAIDYHTSGISVIPLRENKFNSMKSELKMIESGYFCKPCLVSYVAPYTNLATNKNCIKVFNNDWTKAIKRIKGNLNLQVDLGMQLKEDVESKYNLDKENRKRIQLL